MFIRRILAPVLFVLLSILTLSVRPALLTVVTDVYVLNKVSLVNAVKKVYHIPLASRISAPSISRHLNLAPPTRPPNERPPPFSPLGVSNGPVQFESARKICLFSTCSQKLDECSLARARGKFTKCSLLAICYFWSARCSHEKIDHCSCSQQ